MEWEEGLLQYIKACSVCSTIIDNGYMFLDRINNQIPCKTILKQSITKSILQKGTYFNNIRIPLNNNCPQCNANSNELTSFPIVSNESFTFNYNKKRGVEWCLNMDKALYLYAAQRHQAEVSELQITVLNTDLGMFICYLFCFLK